MRVGLVSDLHGNAVALRTVAADVARAGVDEVVCLGDVVQGGPEPSRVLELLQELGWPVVLGNADAFLLDLETAREGGEEITERQLETRAWSVAQLSGEQLDTIAGFSPTVEVDLGGRTLVCCHAVPRSYHPVLLPSTDETAFWELLDGVDADVVAGGHTHMQFLRRRGDLLFVNPGSAGLSYEHGQAHVRIDPWGAWAIVECDGAALRVEFRRVPVDIEAVQASLRASGIPYVEDHVRRWQPRAAERRQQQV